MLVLTRKKNESLMIGEDIEIVIVDIQGDRVRIGINAPKKLPVHRKEVYEEIIEANRAAQVQVEGLAELLKAMKDGE